MKFWDVVLIICPALITGIIAYFSETNDNSKKWKFVSTVFAVSLAFIAGSHSTYEAIRQRDTSRLRNDTLNRKLDSAKKTALKTIDSLSSASSRIARTLINTETVLTHQKQQASLFNKQLVTSKTILAKSDNALAELSKMHIPIGNITIEYMITYNNSNNYYSKWPYIKSFINKRNLKFTPPGKDTNFLSATDSNFILSKVNSPHGYQLYTGGINPFDKERKTVYNQLFADFFWTRVDIDKDNFKNGRANLELKLLDNISLSLVNDLNAFNRIVSRESQELNFISGEITETFKLPLKKYFSDGSLVYLDDLKNAYVHIGLFGNITDCNLIYVRLSLGDDYSNAIFIDNKTTHIVKETGTNFKFKLPENLINMLKTGK